VLAAALERLEEGQDQVLGAVHSIRTAILEQTETSLLARRPTLDIRHAGTTRLRANFDTTWTVEQMPGTPALSEIAFRFRGQRVRPDDKGWSWLTQRFQPGRGRHVAQCHGIFDLTGAPIAIDDWDLAPDELGLAVRFEHAGITWEARCSWTLSYRDTGSKVLVDYGDRGPISYRSVEKRREDES
jgi:hypothetical protein